jgi:hypothetical protein
MERKNEVVFIKLFEEVIHYNMKASYAQKICTIVDACNIEGI